MARPAMTTDSLRPATTSPDRAAKSSLCPFPATPAMPTISPACATRSISFRDWPCRTVDWTDNPRTASSSVSPGGFAPVRTSPTSAPTIRAAISRALRSRGSRVPTTRPPRRMVAERHRRRTSSSLWEMYRIAQPSAHELVEGHEQVLGLLGCEDGGRLVEDQQLRILEQAPHDLDPLPLAGRERPDGPVGLQRQTVIRADPAELRPHRREGPFIRQGHRDVLGHRHLVEEGEMLEDHADAERPRHHRRCDPDCPALPSDLAVGRFDDAVEDLDEGRFARPVLAEQRVDFAGPDLQVDGVVGEEVSVPLADAPELDEGRHWLGIGIHARRPRQLVPDRRRHSMFIVGAPCQAAWTGEHGLFAASS